MTMKMVILMREKSGRLGQHEGYTRAAGPITCKTLAGSHRYGNNNGCIPISPNRGDIPYVTCYEYITWCRYATATQGTCVRAVGTSAAFTPNAYPHPHHRLFTLFNSTSSLTTSRFHSSPGSICSAGRYPGRHRALLPAPADTCSLSSTHYIS